MNKKGKFLLIRKTFTDNGEHPRTAKWCPGEDSNLHGFHHWYLKPARLPIPPPGLQRTHKCRGFALSTRVRAGAGAPLRTAAWTRPAATEGEL